jgi:hypothetical protein
MEKRLAQDEQGRKVMEQPLVQRLREVLGDLPPEDVYAIIAFAQFLSERRQVERETTSKDELAEAEHTRVLRVLDAVAALSSAAETGSPVSNRDHDRYLYGTD